MCENSKALGSVSYFAVHALVQRLEEHRLHPLRYGF